MELFIVLADLKYWKSASKFVIGREAVPSERLLSLLLVNYHVNT